LECGPIALRANRTAKSLGDDRYGRIHAPHHRLWRRRRNSRWRCRLSNVYAAVSAQPTPAYVSTDHDPLFRVHRWRANLRIREIDEIKSVPFVPTSHPFVERLIGTVRRAYLDRVFFWNSVDLTRKLAAFRDYYNTHHVHRSLDGTAARSPRGFIDSHARFVQTLHLATSLRRAVSDPDGGVTTNSPPTRSVRALSRATARNRTLVADVHRTRQGQPVERRPVSRRINPPSKFLGARGHGPIHPSHCRIRRSARCG
jgi:hypothetical protein